MEVQNTLLEYVKVNNNKIEFKKGLNIITCVPKQLGKETNNNIGKTTLIRILQAIYGRRRIYPIKVLLAQKIRKNGYGCFLEWLFIIDGKKHKFFYDINNPKNILYNKERISLVNYKSTISRLLNNRVKVFRDTINMDYRFIRKTSDNFFINETFKNRNQSYIAFFLIKILFGYNFGDIKLKNIEKYFEKVAKRNSYLYIRNRYHNSIIEELMEVDENDRFIELDKLSKEVKKYKLINVNNVDIRIIEELKYLNLDIDFDAVLEFHKSLISDYNDMILNKVEKLEEKIVQIKKEVPETTLMNYSQSDIDIAVEVSDFLKKVNEELKYDYSKIEKLIEELLKSMNLILEEYNKSISKFLEGEIESRNIFGKGRITNEILQSLKFSLKMSDTTGDANKYINAILLYSYILKNGDINIVALDTHHTSEITKKNLQAVLKQIIKNVDDEQYVILLFDDKINESEFENEIIHKIGPNDKTLLGYSI